MTTLPATKQQRLPEVEHGTRPATQRVIIHTIEGSAAGALAWFGNPAAGGIGAQVVVGLEDVHQTTDLGTMCWHCRNANANGIGFEHEGRAAMTRAQWLSKRNRKLLRMSANRTAWVCFHYDLGTPRLRKNVMGHCHVPGNDHTDPGNGWPWTFYMFLCRRAYKSLVRTHGRRWES